MDKHKSVLDSSRRIDFKCHACGHKAQPVIKSIVEPKKVRLQCPGCKTWATITYDNGQDELEGHYRLAEDLEDLWF